MSEALQLNSKPLNSIIPRVANYTYDDFNADKLILTLHFATSDRGKQGWYLLYTKALECCISLLRVV